MSRYEACQAVKKLNPDLYWNSKTQKQMQARRQKYG